MDTIFAVSSGQPPAAIAVIRISGPQAQHAGQALAGVLPEPRRAAVRRLRDPAGGELLDEAIVLVFPGPRSATGEDLVELHVHGGRAVVSAVLGTLAGIPGLRAAEAGEFTRRALMHGRMDLTEAEGLGDLLLAETQAQRRAAQQASEGGLRRQIEQWTDRLLTISAQVEALIDYADEGDVETRDLSELRAPTGTLSSAIEAALSQPRVERLRDGIRVVLAGPPNAGKSSLLNALVQRDAAIVSPVPGTTRDRVEAAITREGVAWLLTDTAGLRIADDAVEREGIARADDAMRAADIVIWLGDDEPPVSALWVHARADEDARRVMPAGPVLKLSAVTGEGVPELWFALASRSAALLPSLDRLVFNARQATLLKAAASSLLSAVAADDLLVVAEELRLARLALDRISGRADVENVLDALFGQFCIGK